jgi:hypothetical protein
VTLYVHEDGTEPGQGEAFSVFVVEPAASAAADEEPSPGTDEDAELGAEEAGGEAAGPTSGTRRAGRREGGGR